MQAHDFCEHPFGGAWRSGMAHNHDMRDLHLKGSVAQLHESQILVNGQVAGTAYMTTVSTG